jgi:hypothetical protein
MVPTIGTESNGSDPIGVSLKGPEFLATAGIPQGRRVVQVQGPVASPH